MTFGFGTYKDTDNFRKSSLEGVSGGRYLCANEVLEGEKVCECEGEVIISF